METIRCDIVSAHEQIYSGEANRVIVPGAAGELGIYPRHAPLMTLLKPGPLRVVQSDGEEFVFFAGGGILEVMPHLVTVLADTAVRADHLDQAAAVRARDEAERKLKDQAVGMEFAEAELQLKRALAELRAIEQFQLRTKYKKPEGSG